MGGISTLIGTPPNALLKGFLENQYNIDIAFFNWMLFATPLALVLFIIAYFGVLYTFKINKIAKLDDTSSLSSNYFQEELKKLGSLSYPEKVVAVVFLITALSWIFKKYINQLFSISLTDEIIAISALLSLFLIPVSLKKKEFIMDVKSFLARVPWDILLLFGGGLALSDLFIKTGFSTWIANSLGFLATASLFISILVVVFAMAFATEFTSNASITAIFLPITAALAIQFNINPLLLAIPVTIASSCVFILPIGTPANAVVFGSGKLSVVDMLKFGLIFNIIAVIIISVYSYYLLDLFF